LTVREAYEDSLRRDGHVRDPAQRVVVDQLDELRERLLENESRRRWWLLRRKRMNPGATNGLYLWGAVGRGKTFLMDLFFETLPLRRKTRIHFHRMMRDVHRRLAALEDAADPLDRVAADIAKSTRVLCFDEFFVSDIGDAMILARLLDGLFRRDVTLVATSNTQPGELYRDGLQRDRFLPAIDLLVAHTRVINIGGDVDYRLRLLEEAGTFLAPDDDSARRRLARLFDESASSQIAADRALEINGREIRTRRSAKAIIWFEFADICDGPRSQNDYIEIARWYPTVIVSGIPALDGTSEDQARRLVSLVDEFYDRRVKLIVSAAAPPHELYTGNKLQLEFERTASRLVEMQSTDYLAAPHLS
jgi:cell division protein ZapE